MDAVFHSVTPPLTLSFSENKTSIQQTYNLNKNDFKVKSLITLPSSAEHLFYVSSIPTGSTNAKPKKVVCASKAMGPGADFRADSSPEEEPENKNVTWMDESFDANDITIHYYKSNLESDDQAKFKIDLPLSLKSSSKPKFVFLHGLGASGDVLQNLMSDLADRFEIILPTARGHGKTNPIPSGSFLMENLVADAVAVINHVSPDSAVYLGGHSMGASTAARVAAQYPNLVKALVLEDPPWLRLASDSLKPKPRDEMPLPLKMAKNMQALTMDETKTKSGTSMVQAQRSLNVDALLPTFHDTDDVINEAVEGIQIPTLLQLGQKDCGAVLDNKLAEKVVDGWSSGKIVSFDDAGHVIHSGSNRSPWLNSVREYLDES